MIELLAGMMLALVVICAVFGLVALLGAFVSKMLDEAEKSFAQGQESDPFDDWDIPADEDDGRFDSWDSSEWDKLVVEEEQAVEAGRTRGRFESAIVLGTIAVLVAAAGVTYQIISRKKN